MRAVASPVIYLTSLGTESISSRIWGILSTIPVMSQTATVVNDIPLDFVIESVLSDKFVEAFANIPQETLKFASDETNRKFITQSVLNSLHEKNPDLATPEMAKKVTDKLIEYAKVQTGK